MNRRRYLTAIGIGLFAGCPAKDSTSANSRAETPTETQTATETTASAHEITELEETFGSTQWEETFGTTDGEASHVLYDSTDGIEGGQVVTGCVVRRDSGSNFVHPITVAVDSEGTEEWRDDPANLEGVNEDAVTLPDGYLIVGNRKSGERENGDWRYRSAIRKYGTDGAQQWRRSFGTGTDSEYLYGALVGSNSYLLYGVQHVNSWENTGATVLNIDSDGTELWSKTITSSGPVSFRGGQSVADGFVLVGAKDNEAYATKFDSNGSQQWEVTRKNRRLTRLHAISYAGNGFLAVGVTGTREGDLATSDGLVVKISGGGTIEWTTALTDGKSGYYDITPSDAGYYLVGFEGKFDPNSYAWIREVDPEGRDVIDEVSYGFRDVRHGYDDAVHRNVFYSIDSTTDGGYLVVGKKTPNSVDEENNTLGWALKAEDPIAALKQMPQ